MRCPQSDVTKQTYTDCTNLAHKFTGLLPGFVGIIGIPPRKEKANSMDSIPCPCPPGKDPALSETILYPFFESFPPGDPFVDQKLKSTKSRQGHMHPLTHYLRQRQRQYLSTYLKSGHNLCTPPPSTSPLLSLPKIDSRIIISSDCSGLGLCTYLQY